MTTLFERAAILLGRHNHCESTGMRKQSTPLLDKMRGVLRIAGIGGMVSLAACSNMDLSRQKEYIGTGLGAIGGAIIGAQFGKGNGQLVGVALGTLGGAFLGNSIGASLDNADRAVMARAETKAHSAPLHHTVTWKNPDTGAQGSITPVREGVDRENNQCREYHQTVSIGGKTEEAYGTACLQRDGSWKIVSYHDDTQFDNLAALEAPSQRMG
ncbi:RT0821/Lpp0805 family surface protein [Thalassospira xianhensis]|uniref:RT0821/Lpp0805 family surface protein n=1 Tax=Thalassospira xianhensis TaxID=478503 RepID=UPI001FC955C7|nr:RT0821/Lpp0805 family surface protein [Thalassospira xianhensis]